MTSRSIAAVKLTLLAWITVLPAPACGSRIVTVTASGETAPVAHEGDAADDVAIWVHPSDPSASTVIGTDKDGGLLVYDLQGRQIQLLDDGATNNVDLRNGFPLNGDLVSLVAASRPQLGEIGFYRVDPATGLLIDLGGVHVEGFHPRGLCLYHSASTGQFHVFAADSRGQLLQLEIRPAAQGLELHLVRRVSFSSTIEGCVTDDAAGALYVSQESEGIWFLEAEPDGSGAPVLVDAVGNGRLEPDIEGLALTASGGIGLLVASSQSRDAFQVYLSRPPFTYVGGFRIAAGNGIDGVSHTDGLEITAAALGPRFPGGLLVVQDDENDQGNQNFKLVAWDKVLDQLEVSRAQLGTPVSEGGIAIGKSADQIVFR